MIQDLLPYIVSIVCALIAAVTSIMVSRKGIKGEIDKLIKQHEMDMEIEREKHKNEIERLEIEHKHQLELLQNESANRMGADVVSTVITETMKTPEIKSQIIKSLTGQIIRGKSN